MTSADPRVGWVESPLQLINAVEWAASAAEPAVVLARDGVAQLAATAAWLEPLLPEHVIVHPAASASDPRFLRAGRRLIGDAFSGQFRAVVARTGARDLVVVDDGSAALHLAAVLASRDRFGRMGQREPLAQRALGTVTARHLRAAARAGRLELFTAYAEDATLRRPAGARIVPNGYAWLRGLTAPPPVDLPASVVLGSALAVDGYVDAAAYAHWAVTVAPGAAYLPHRREEPRALDRLRDAGLEVIEPGLPAEIVLGAARAVESVHSLPSSTGATLARVLDPRVRLDVTAVPEAWWTPRADATLRATLTYLAHAGRHDQEEN